MLILRCEYSPWINFILLLPGRGAKYCDKRVCVSVCQYVHSHISKTTRPNFTKLSLTRGRCNSLLDPPSGFVDDVMFSHNWPWRLALSVNASSQKYVQRIPQVAPHCLTAVVHNSSKMIGPDKRLTNGQRWTLGLCIWWDSIASTKR